MSAAFVAQLRSRPGVVRLAPDGDRHITVRVQMPEVWDVIRVETPPDTPVAALKARALEALFPQRDGDHEFVLKLNGFEVLDESASIAESGARDGSTFLLTHRRRRPVR